MKVKKSFITNSSSANFIITIFSSYDDLDSFKRYMTEFIKQLIENSNFSMTHNEVSYEMEKLDDIIKNVKHIGPNIFEIIEFTPMLNYVLDDLPKWVLGMLVLKALGETYPFIKEVTIRVEN